MFGVKAVTEMLLPRHGDMQGVAREVLKGLAEASFRDDSRRSASGQPTWFQGILDFGLLFKKAYFIAEISAFLSRLASFHKLS